MNEQKKCIFYLPYKLDEQGMGARMLRPRKMIRAFRDIGYDVFTITGYSKERKERIQEIKAQISKEEQFDFMYAESNTEPILLTDPNHLPTHPLLDFSFFRYVRNHGIKIGLFYGDLYWKFDTYGAGLPAWKKESALACYRYEMKQYRKTLDVFYVPDLQMCTYLQKEQMGSIAAELPPGADQIEAEKKDYSHRDFTKDPLTVFYVGGLGNHYQIAELVKAINQTDHTRLILCCREPEYRKEKKTLEPWLCDRISIIHKMNDELEPYYQFADIGSLMFRESIYMNMARPFKAYEYLAHEIPALSTKGTGIGTFVEENDIGWNIPYDAENISKILKTILSNPMLIEEKREHCRTTKSKNLWTSRAEQVARELHG